MQTITTSYGQLVGQFTQYRTGRTTDTLLGFPAVLKALMPLRGARVLDYGCGTGYFAGLMRLFGTKEVFGVDTSEEMINQARERYPNLNFQIFNGHKLDFLEASFDAVTLNFVLCAISTRQEVMEVLEECHRVLKPEGKIVILDSNRDQANGSKFMSFSLDYADLYEDGPMRTTLFLPNGESMTVTDYYRSVESYTQMLRDVGFQQITVTFPQPKERHYGWKDETKVPPFHLHVGVK